MHKPEEMKKVKLYPILENKYFEVLKTVLFCDATCRPGLPHKENFQRDREYFTELKEGLFRVANSVTGQRIIDLTGIESGPEIGRIIRKAREHILQYNEINQDRINALIKKEAQRCP
jgi:hypothetical protein